MSFKNAALLALIGTFLLTLLVMAHFISTLFGVMHDVIPAVALGVSALVTVTSRMTIAVAALC
jgi:hypothetical protein